MWCEGWKVEMKAVALDRVNDARQSPLVIGKQKEMEKN